jgi:hypothetical protein
MPPPNLAFASKWRRSGNKAPLFRFWTRSNIVLHMSLSVPAHVQAYRTSLYRRPPATRIKTARALCACNLEATKGRQAHYRIRTKANGKFLVFGTGNIILAGRKSHSSAALSCVRMVSMLSGLPNAGIVTWPAYLSSPNAVLTGQVAHVVLPTLKNDTINVNHSTKFPGIAIAIAEPGVTPELYLRRGMLIAPGVTSPGQFARVLDNIDTVIRPHVNFTELSGVRTPDGSPRKAGR